VLVVDDEPRVLDALEAVLAAEFRVLRAGGGEAALEILATDAVAVIVTDYRMPGMNGVELAGIVRERYPGLPVVLTSGYSNVLAENAHRGFELIQKPYSVELLSRSLRKAISEARPQEA